MFDRTAVLHYKTCIKFVCQPEISKNMLEEALCFLHDYITQFIDQTCSICGVPVAYH